MQTKIIATPSVLYTLYSFCGHEDCASATETSYRKTGDALKSEISYAAAIADFVKINFILDIWLLD